MGTIGRKIVGIDVKELVRKLNSALADEWLAYYQYWIGAKVAVGPMRGAVAAELEEHAKEELEHAEMLAERIIVLGGTPVLKPEEWYKVTNCGYATPEDPKVGKLLEQNIKGEQCAINFYKEVVELTRGKDEITFNMIVKIMADEVEHEEDLQAIMEDLNAMR